MLNRRQIEVQHRNLSSMCRITVKSLIDYACVNTHVDENSEEFVNFCAVFEQMVAHRLRPYQKKVWHRGQAAPRNFWDVMLDNHRQGPLFRSCIPNIAAIEYIKSPKAKLRAFVRVALMEKRLSDYLYWIQNNRSLMTECYLEGALFVSEEGVELCGEIIGLSAIDFNFCLKGNENELLGPFEINYAPFLNYSQSPASRLIDEEEMLLLSGKSPNDGNDDVTEQYSEDKIKLASLEMDFRRVKEQKDYLEELVRLRERQTGEANTRVEISRKSMQTMEKDWENEKKTLDTCILELQEEITTLRNQNSLLKQQVSELQLFKSNMDYRDVPMVDMALVPILPPQEESSDDKKDDRPQAVAMLPIQDSSSQMSSDQRSIISSISDQIRLKEDSQSLVPLTGSLADVNVAMIRDAKQSGEESRDDCKKAESGYSKTKEKLEGMELTLFHADNPDTAPTTTTLVACSSHTMVTEPFGNTSMSASSSPSPGQDTATTITDGKFTTASLKLEESYIIAERDNDDGGLDADETNKITKTSSNTDETPAELTITQITSCDTNDGSGAGQGVSDMAGDGDGNQSQNAMSQALRDLENAFDQDEPEMQKVDPLQVSSSDSTSSNGDSSGQGLEEINTSSASEPEILDRVNVSSEGSDAAWELLSDPEDTESNARSPEN